MIHPGRITVDQAARNLTVPTGFYRLLASHGLVPAANHDGQVDAGLLTRSRLAHPWLNYLSERVDRVQAREWFGRMPVMPQDHLTNVAGRDVTELWRIIQATLLECGF